MGVAHVATVNHNVSLTSYKPTVFRGYMTVRSFNLRGGRGIRFFCCGIGESRLLQSKIGSRACKITSQVFKLLPVQEKYFASKVRIELFCYGVVKRLSAGFYFGFSYE